MTCHICGDPGARPYGTGPCCPLHTPAAIAGRPEPYIDPALTLVALQARAGFKVGYSRADTALVDERAWASGRRANGRAAWLRTQQALKSQP